MIQAGQTLRKENYRCIELDERVSVCLYFGQAAPGRSLTEGNLRLSNTSD